MKEHLKVIHTNKEYEIALKTFQTIFHVETGSKEEEEAKQLATLIEDYENKHFKIPND